MAVKTFDEITAQLSADERKLLDNTLSKHPELREGWLRQDDYSRKMNEFKTKETELETVKARNAHLEGWAETNVPIWEGLVERGIISEDGEDLVSQKQAELQRELEEARKAAIAGADMKPEELDARVKEIVKQAGGVTQEEYKALIAQESRKVAQEEFKTGWDSKQTEFNEKTVPFVAGFSSATAVVAARFERETGEQWTAERQKEMFELMSREKNFDPFAMEEKILAPFKEKKARAKEIEEEVQKRTASIRAEQGGDGDYIPQEVKQKGALRQMLERSAEPQDFQSLIDQQAKKAGAELRAAGKG